MKKLKFLINCRQLFLKNNVWILKTIIIAIALIYCVLILDFEKAYSSTLFLSQTSTNVNENQVLLEGLFDNFGLINIFIIFLLTLGPLKLIPAFVKLTKNYKQNIRHQLALKSFFISTLVILGVAILSQRVLKSWQINISAMLLTTGIILFLVALKNVLAQYNYSLVDKEIIEENPRDLTINPLVFPSILTPYGIALVVTISAIFAKIQIPLIPLFLILSIIMFLNLGAMFFAYHILYWIKPITLKILSFVFSVMQVALGLDMIIRGIKMEVLIMKMFL